MGHTAELGADPERGSRAQPASRTLRERHTIGGSTRSICQSRVEAPAIGACIDRAAAPGFARVEIFHIQERYGPDAAREAIERLERSLGLVLIGFSARQGFVTPDTDPRRTNVPKTLDQGDRAYQLGLPAMREQHRPPGHPHVARRRHGQ